MAPPANEATVAGGGSIGVLSWSDKRVAGSIRIGHVVALGDAWALLAVMWAARIAWGRLGTSSFVFGLIALAAILMPGSRSDKVVPSGVDDFFPVLKRIAFAYAAATAVVTLGGFAGHAELLGIAAPLVPALVAVRTGSYRLHRILAARGQKGRALVVGGGIVARRIVAALEEHDEYGLEVVGAVDDDPKFDVAHLGTRMLGGSDAIPDLIRDRRVDVVIVGFSSTSHAGMVERLRAARAAGASVWIVPRFFELGMPSFGDHLWGLPVIKLPATSSGAGWIAKRALDVVAASVGLVVAGPVMLAIAGATLLSSGRPVLNRQIRVGRGGREFEMLKFRTMVPRPEGIESVEWSPDPERVTRLGRFLRDTSLDELPQLINIIRGDMSLVGPRPERPYFVERFSEQFPGYAARHRAPAGLTGWSQVNGLRGDTSIEERAAFDNYYVDSWSLGQDLKILAKTLTAFTRSAGGRDES